jgi:hypothetical protein
MLEQATTVEQELGSCVIVMNSNIPSFWVLSRLGDPPSDPMEQWASQSTIVISVA